MIESRAPRRMRHSWEARCRLVRLMLDGVCAVAAAVVCGASRATAYRALARYRVGGWEALRDRRRSPGRTLRGSVTRPSSRSSSCGERPGGARSDWPGCWAGRRRDLAGAASARHLSRAARRPPANRYEYAAPELCPLDIKQLGRFWQFGKRALGESVGHRSPRAGWSICTWPSTITRAMRSRNCARHRPALTPWPF